MVCDCPMGNSHKPRSASATRIRRHGYLQRAVVRNSNQSTNQPEQPVEACLAVHQSIQTCAHKHRCSPPVHVASLFNAHTSISRGYVVTSRGLVSRGIMRRICLRNLCASVLTTIIASRPDVVVTSAHCERSCRGGCGCSCS